MRGPPSSHDRPQTRHGSPSSQVKAVKWEANEIINAKSPGTLKELLNVGLQSCLVESGNPSGKHKCP